MLFLFTVRLHDFGQIDRYTCMKASLFSLKVEVLFVVTVVHRHFQTMNVYRHSLKIAKNIFCGKKMA